MSVLIMISIFAQFTFVSILTWTLVLLSAIQLSTIPTATIFRNVVPFIWLFVFTIAVHSFFGPETSHPRIEIRGFSLGLHNVAFALKLCWRIVLFIAFSSLLTLTTSPLEITDAIESMFRPLKRYGFPVHELAIMISLAVRFVPTILMEAERLQRAQKARGASFKGSILQRIRSLSPLVLPLFINTFYRAEELAMAMEARCYGIQKHRTSYGKLCWKSTDTVAVVLVCVLICVLIFL